MGPPVIVSALTTCAGFLSFLAMDVAPMRRFGLAAAAGVLVVAVLSISLVPAALSYLHHLPRKKVFAPLSQALGGVASFSEKHRKTVLVVAVILCISGLLGLLRIGPDATLKIGRAHV